MQKNNNETFKDSTELFSFNETLIYFYLEDAEAVGLTERTIENYKSCLRTFSFFLEKNLMTADIKDLKSFKLFLERQKNSHNQPYSPSTINRYFSALHSFYEFLDFDDHIDKNPMTKFRKRYLQDYKRKKHNNGNSKRKLISVEEMSKLVNSIINPRDKAVVLLLAKTGIRRNELIQLDIDDINWKENNIDLKPTPKRTNLTVFFDDECARILKRWKISRENWHNNGSQALFLNERGERLNRHGVYHIVTKYAEKIGIHNPDSHKLKDRFTPHCCRHWFTTHLRRNGMDREYVKELRGDTRNEAIDIYHHIDEKELKDAYTACIPQLNV